ncbi:MAG: SDR family NAD(P)-dependent oxidoreductase, partial [Candidatus ainarchaeum sp.]|nr:SDR family NAD(P)-dependent oxidoreductase [Candidatus ainarchaeum sp.]
MGRKPNILVIGATGFIGSRLVKRLVEHGNKPRILARKQSNLALLSEIDKKKIEIFYGDVTNKGQLRKAIRGSDYVFNISGVL